jgi:hypothetical protein
MTKWVIAGCGVLLGFAGCFRSGAVSPSRADCVSPVARGNEATEKHGARVTKLPVSSRMLLINRAANLVVGYQDVDIKNRGPQRRFTILNFNDDPAGGAAAHLDDPVELAKLDAQVNEFLSHGTWEAMVPARREVNQDGPVWSIADYKVVSARTGQLEVLDPGVLRLPFSPYVVLPGLPDCPAAMELEISGLAMDPLTARVFVTYARTAGPDCPSVDYAHTFILWKASDFYPHYVFMPYQN